MNDTVLPNYADVPLTNYLPTHSLTYSPALTRLEVTNSHTLTTICDDIWGRQRQVDVNVFQHVKASGPTRSNCSCADILWRIYLVLFVILYSHLSWIHYGNTTLQ